MANEIIESLLRIKSGRSSWGFEFDRWRNYLHLLPKQNWSDIDKYFIISTGRTGTQFLARFFNEFKSVYSVHEPKPDFVKLGVDYAYGQVDKSKAVKKIERGRRAICKDVKRHGKDMYVESNNRVFSLIGALDEVFDDYKIIHIVRDGRDYVRSGMSRDWWYTDKDWNPRMKASEFKDDPYRDKWEDMSRFEKICWRWQKKDGIIYESLIDKDNFIRLKFEDIFKDEDYAGIYEMGEYIGLENEEIKKNIEKMMDRKINATKEYEIDKWPEWTEEMIETFEEIAGDHMKKYFDYSWES